MALCTTGVLAELLDAVALLGPMRLLAGAAEAVVARMMDMAAANKLTMRVVFMIWCFDCAVSHSGLFFVDLEHRFHGLINRRVSKPLKMNSIF